MNTNAQKCPFCHLFDPKDQISPVEEDLMGKPANVCGVLSCYPCHLLAEMQPDKGAGMVEAIKSGQYQIIINKNVVYEDYDESRVFFHFEQLKKQTSRHIFLIKNGLPIRERKPLVD